VTPANRKIRPRLPHRPGQPNYPRNRRLRKTSFSEGRGFPTKSRQLEWSRTNRGSERRSRQRAEGQRPRAADRRGLSVSGSADLQVASRLPQESAVGLQPTLSPCHRSQGMVLCNPGFRDDVTERTALLLVVSAHRSPPSGRMYLSRDPSDQKKMRTFSAAC
jgi:hypothetical protein